MLRTLTATVIALTVLLVTGCAPAAPESPAPPEVEESEPITPVRQDLTSVVVIPGTVAATPTYLLVAPRSGTVRLDAASAQGAGDRVGTIAGTPLTLPHAGKIGDTLVAPGQFVAAGVPIARVSYAGFGIPIAVPAEQLFRLYAKPSSARASIAAGPEGVECALAPTDEPGDAAPDAAETDIPGGPAVCLLPLDAAVVASLPARVGLATGTVKDALTLPVAAVAGSAQAGRVTVVEGTTTRVVDVTLGMTDGVSIEVTEGIDEKTMVLPYAPGF